MIRKTITIISLCLALSACVSQNALMYDPNYANSEIQIFGGRQTNMELPIYSQVMSIRISNPSIVAVEYADNVITFLPKACVGATHVTIQVRDQNWNYKTFYYHVFVEADTNPHEEFP